MKIKAFHYSGCSTCKDALRWLKVQSLPFEATDLIDTPPTPQILAQIQTAAQVPAKALFNVNGLVYRGDGWAEKSVGMDDAAILQALSENGRLIKRPLLLVCGENGGDRAAIGFRAADWQKILVPQ